MKVRLHDKDLKEFFIEHNYPNGFVSNQDQGVTEHVFSGSLIGGEGSFRELFMENIHIGYGDMLMHNRTEVDFDSEMNTVEMHFALKGNTLAKERGGSRTIQFAYNQHNILCSSHFKGRVFYAPSKDIKRFEVNLMPDFFKRFLPEEEKAFFAFLKSINKGEFGFLSPYHYPITPQMHWLIQEILNCNRKGAYKRFFLEAKVTELLILQLEQISALQNPCLSPLDQLEVDRMHAVKDYLDINLNEPHTLMDLAHLFGTNDYNLKKGFKELFGTTVFNYWNGVKMKHARQMLLDKEIKISEIAYEIGYKNPQHFTTAFKKRFGYPPSKLRKN